MIGKTIAHYHFTEKLGAGGMGEVFLADDPSLGRKVALKFPSRELQQDPVARKRLLHQTKAGAALDHPNICNIHEIAQAEGKDFIVMEHVEGQSFSNRLLAGSLLQAAAIGYCLPDNFIVLQQLKILFLQIFNDAAVAVRNDGPDFHKLRPDLIRLLLAIRIFCRDSNIGDEKKKDNFPNRASL
jgi:serine/threonine protein kinase